MTLTRRTVFILLALILTVFLMTYYSNIHTFVEEYRNKIYRYTIYDITKMPEHITNMPKSNSKLNQSPRMKYILQWNQADYVPFVYMDGGQKGFILRQCLHTNCFFTSNKMFLDDVTKYDAISFAGPELLTGKLSLPQRRSPHQKYIFSTMESSDNYPSCSNKFNGYFNWTWTYKLDSEINLGYLSIWDKDGNIVGPKTDMTWIRHEDMDPASNEFKKQLKSKKIAAAWFASNCDSRSKREDYFEKLQKEFKNYDLEVDVYGKCGTKQCPRDNEEKCFQLVKENYYFYLSFENSLTKDYVTEKLLMALNNDAIPVVFGGANYSRFLPPGSYLDSRELGAEKLANKMKQLIDNLDEYAEYFRWKKYYSYHTKFQNKLAKEYCLICSLMNDREKLEQQSVYEDFSTWWNPPGRC